MAADDHTSERMKRVRQRGTEPELAVRRMLRSLGVQYRLNNKNLPGSPDVANRRGRWAVFVHGCYWHHHHGCRHATVPKKNRDFWVRKFADNQARDARKEAELEAMGFEVIVVWQCELKDPEALAAKLRARLPGLRTQDNDNECRNSAGDDSGTVSRAHRGDRRP